MHNIKELESDVNFVRKKYIDYIQNLNNDQGNFKPSPEAWSVAEITEHLVYAEYGGICGLYSALNKYRKGIKTWEGPNPNLNLNIEEIISRTWKEKEIAPDPASP